MADIAPYAVILYKEPVYPIYYHRVRDEKNHNMYFKRLRSELDIVRIMP